jgi:hypothetical protein
LYLCSLMPWKKIIIFKSLHRYISPISPTIGSGLAPNVIKIFLKII